MTTQRSLAHWLLRRSRAMLPPHRELWASAMSNELAYLTNDRQALRWAAGCFSASLRDRLNSFHIPDGPVIRLFAACLLLLLAVADVFPTIGTAAYRLGATEFLHAGGKMTPGDDYVRLIPLMEALPLWLHGMMGLAATLYLFTVLRLVFGKVSWIPVAVAMLFEIGADLLGRRIGESVGVVVNPNPSWIAILVPILMPLGLALLLWKLRLQDSARI